MIDLGLKDLADIILAEPWRFQPLLGAADTSEESDDDDDDDDDCDAEGDDADDDDDEDEDDIGPAFGDPNGPSNKPGSQKPKV